MFLLYIIYQKKSPSFTVHNPGFYPFCLCPFSRNPSSCCVHFIGYILYSHKGYPYDNACIESFHALIKREWLDRFKITDFRHTYRLVFEYIEAFYNTVRIHSHCDYMSPDQYEKLYQKVTAA